MKWMVCIALGWVLGVETLRAESLVEGILSSYDAVESMTCDVRKDTVTDEGRIRMLSRVHFQRPDRIHVENHAPVRRRIVADGARLYYHIEGEPKGFSRPVDELDAAWSGSLRQVPGTAMEHLFRLRGVEGSELDATDEFPRRRGYDTGRTFAVLSVDEKGRLARIEFYLDSQMSQRTARIDYDAFEEVLDGVWIPTVHQSEFALGGMTSRETSRFSNLSVNTSIPEHLFDPGPFFRDVEWVSSFEEM